MTTAEQVTPADQTTSIQREHPTPPYRASQQMADKLQQITVDLIDLHLLGKQAHWNVVGRNFRDLHLQLDELVDAAREFTDELAERMRALYVTIDGTAARVAETSNLTKFPTGEVETSQTANLVVKAIYDACGTMRGFHDDIDDEDPTTADLLHGFLTRLEQLAWMIDAENRIPNVSDPEPLHE